MNKKSAIPFVVLVALSPVLFIFQNCQKSMSQGAGSFGSNESNQQNQFVSAQPTAGIKIDPDNSPVTANPGTVSPQNPSSPSSNDTNNPVDKVILSSSLGNPNLPTSSSGQNQGSLTDLILIQHVPNSRSIVVETEELPFVNCRLEMLDQNQRWVALSSQNICQAGKLIINLPHFGFNWSYSDDFKTGGLKIRIFSVGRNLELARGVLKCRVDVTQDRNLLGFDYSCSGQFQ